MFSTCTIRKVVPLIRSFVTDFKSITDIRESILKSIVAVRVNTDNRTNENSEQTRLTKS